MKNHINTLIEQVIRDNHQFIMDSGGNVKEYLLAELQNADQGQYFYLSSEEAEEWDNNPESREGLMQTIVDTINEYDYNLSRKYYVDIEHSMRPETITCDSYEEASELVNEMNERGTKASAYYVDNDKVYDAFTEEEIVTED